MSRGLFMVVKARDKPNFQQQKNIQTNFGVSAQLNTSQQVKYKTFTYVIYGYLKNNFSEWKRLDLKN